jgi:ORF6N domain
MRAKTLVDVGSIQRAVLRVRTQNVMLDSDLATLYGVEVKALNQAVRRNKDRFPTDFMFRLSATEAASLRSQTVTANAGRGGRRTPPFAFTEQGVAMLSSVLRSPRAVRVNIEIMRAFVQLRRMLGANEELARKLDALEQKYDGRSGRSAFAARHRRPLTWLRDGPELRRKGVATSRRPPRASLARLTRGV